PHREKDPLGLADYGIPDQLVQRFHHLAVGGTVAAELGFQVLDGAGLHLDGPLDLVSHWHTGNTLLHILSAPPAASGGRDFTAGQLLQLARTQKQPRSAAGPCTRSHPSGPDDMRLQAVCRQGTDRAVGGFALLRLAGFFGAPRRALAKTGARLRVAVAQISGAGRGPLANLDGGPCSVSAVSAAGSASTAEPEPPPCFVRWTRSAALPSCA